MGDKPLELLKKKQQELAKEAEALVAKLQQTKQMEKEMASRLNAISTTIREFDNIIKQLTEEKT